MKDLNYVQVCTGYCKVLLWSLSECLKIKKLNKKLI